MNLARVLTGAAAQVAIFECRPCSLVYSEAAAGDDLVQQIGALTPDNDV